MAIRVAMSMAFLASLVLVIPLRADDIEDKWLNAISCGVDDDEVIYYCLTDTRAKKQKDNCDVVNPYADVSRKLDIPTNKKIHTCSWGTEADRAKDSKAYSEDNKCTLGAPYYNDMSRSMLDYVSTDSSSHCQGHAL